MTATDILSSWRAVRPALGRKCAGWLTLLTIAEAGERGITRQALRRVLGSPGVAHTHSIRSWASAGLITWSESAPDGTGGRSPGIARITPKGLRFLRIAP